MSSRRGGRGGRSGRGGRGGSRSPQGRGGKRGTSRGGSRGGASKRGGSRKAGSSKSGSSSKSKKSKPKKSSSSKKKKNAGLMKTLRKILPCLEVKPEVNLEGMSLNAVKLLGFSEQDIIKIKLRFDEIDIDQTGEIDYNEFLDDISETRSPFVDAVFSLVDV